MVYDNEFLVPADEDAFTLVEVFDTLMDAIYKDLNVENDSPWTTRTPMISSIDRNLQAEMTDRLIDLATGRVRMFRTVRTLALHKVRGLHDRLQQISRKNLDPYSQAHLDDMQERLQKALDAVYTM
jgi:hypothetical protein